MATDTLSVRVARTIRLGLDAKQLTQESLAEAAGIPMRTLARRLHPVNPSPLSLEELSVIAAAMGMSMGDLLQAAEQGMQPEAVAS